MTSKPSYDRPPNLSLSRPAHPRLLLAHPHARQLCSLCLLPLLPRRPTLTRSTTPPSYTPSARCSRPKRLTGAGSVPEPLLRQSPVAAHRQILQLFPLMSSPWLAAVEIRGTAPVPPHCTGCPRLGNTLHVWCFTTVMRLGLLIFGYYTNKILTVPVIMEVAVGGSGRSSPVSA